MATTYEPISSTTLGADAASVTLSSIPGTYTDLILVCNTKDTRAISGGCDFALTVNGSTASDYSRTRLYGDGSSASSSRQSSVTNINISQPGASSSFQAQIFHFMNYSNTTTYKTVLVRSNHAGAFVIATVGLWRSTSAITSITLTGEVGIASGSTFTLYGIKAE
jgi:hypothetical protein